MSTVEQFVRERYWPKIRPTLSSKWAENTEILLEKLIAGLGNFEIGDVPIEEVDAWWFALLAQYKSPVTPNKVLVRGKHLFKTAIRWGAAKSNPLADLKKLKEPEKKFTALTEQVHEDLFEGASEKLQWYIIFARYTGARLGSLAKLEERDVNLHMQELTFRETKNGEDYTIPIHPVLQHWVSKALTGNPERRLLPQYKDTHSVSQLFRRLRLRHGVNFRYHDYRHNVGTALAAKGHNVKVIMKALGHKDVKMSIRYTHVASETLRTALTDAL